MSNIFTFLQSYKEKFTGFWQFMAKIHQFWWKFSGISAYDEDQNLLDSQISWDFETNCWIFQKMFFEKEKTSKTRLEKIRSKMELEET